MLTETLQKDIVMTIYSSQGKNQNRIAIKGNSFWEDIKKIVRNNGYNIDSMRAIESTRKGVLEHPKALIPNEDFNLHLYPVKSKGGGKKPTLDRKYLTGTIKSHFLAYGDKAKKHFNVDKSYTNKSSEELDKLLTKWQKTHSLTTENLDTPSTPATTKAHVQKPSKAKKELISDIVDSLAESAKETVADTPHMTIKTCIHLLRSFSGHENQSNVEQAITQLEKALITKPTPSEEELLKIEHAEMGAGLENIVR